MADQSNGRHPRFDSPVMELDGAWIRPGELLVDRTVEPAFEPLLRELGGDWYRPGNRSDFRRSVGAGHINDRLDSCGAGIRLCSGLSEADQIELIRNPRWSDVLRPNHVFVGQDFYHGGPDGLPVAVEDPPTTPGFHGDRQVDIVIFDNGMPVGGHEIHGERVRQVDFLTMPPGVNPVDENNDSRLDAQAGHGLFICGLVARTAPQHDIQLSRVMHATGEADEALIISALAEAARAALTMRVFCFSLGGYTVDDKEPLLATTVRDVILGGHVVVAAAGNAGHDPALRSRPFWPAAMREVIAVGAYDSTNGRPARWEISNGADVYAPGVKLRSSYVSGWAHPEGTDQPRYDGWAWWSGTSFAAPLIAAEIAALPTVPSEGTRRDSAREWLAQLPEAPPDWPTTPSRTGGRARLYVPARNPVSW